MAKVVARVYTVSPKFAERFAIRLLAINIKGPRSFEELKTLDDGTICDTFTAAARVLSYRNKCLYYYISHLRQEVS